MPTTCKYARMFAIASLAKILFTQRARGNFVRRLHATCDIQAYVHRQAIVSSRRAISIMLVNGSYTNRDRYPPMGPHQTMLLLIHYPPACTVYAGFVLPCNASVLIRCHKPVNFKLRASHGVPFSIICISCLSDVEARCNMKADIYIMYRGGQEAVNTNCLPKSISTRSVEASWWLW